MPVTQWTPAKKKIARRDAKCDCRYSQLDGVFARLLHEKRIDEHELTGLGEDKPAVIRRIASLG